MNICRFKRENKAQERHPNIRNNVPTPVGLPCVMWADCLEKKAASEELISPNTLFILSSLMRRVVRSCKVFLLLYKFSHADNRGLKLGGRSTSNFGNYLCFSERWATSCLQVILWRFQWQWLETLHHDPSGIHIQRISEVTSAHFLAQLARVDWLVSSTSHLQFYNWLKIVTILVQWWLHLAELSRLHQDFISPSFECDTPCASAAFMRVGLVSSSMTIFNKPSCSKARKISKLPKGEITAIKFNHLTYILGWERNHTRCHIGNCEQTNSQFK